MVIVKDNILDGAGPIPLCVSQNNIHLTPNMAFKTRKHFQATGYSFFYRLNSNFRLTHSLTQQQD